MDVLGKMACTIVQGLIVLFQIIDAVSFHQTLVIDGLFIYIWTTLETRPFTGLVYRPVVCVLLDVGRV